jgi:hypothetical protein
MGDCDLTYDFRELAPFIEKLKKGNEFVMGSRLAGYIEPDAMPRLHRYFGTPVTTWILNVIYRTGFTDMHCGMRAVTLDALKRMDLRSAGWEYASEMIVKAKRLKLRTAEVPVRFYRDREGRESHHKRVGWHSPWAAGWDNLKTLILYAPGFFLLAPGLAMLVLGLLLTLSQVGGPIDLGPVGLDLHSMLLGVALVTLGYSGIQLGVLASMHNGLDPGLTSRVQRIISFDRGALAALVLVTAGIVFDALFVADWIGRDFKLAEVSHTAVFGLLLIILGLQTFGFVLLVEIIGRDPGGDRAERHS